MFDFVADYISVANTSWSPMLPRVHNPISICSLEIHL